MNAPPPLRMKAPAKINWTLEIVGRRPDGFHEIDTILQTVSLCDELTFRATGGDACEVACDAADVPMGEGNLVWRAWDAMRRATGGRVGGVRIELVKRIPSGAGLGGGSSDAATTLLGLNELFGAGLKPEALMALAAGLGSDVPFFIAGGAARARGRGELISPLASRLPALPLVIVFPGFKSETPWAYRQLLAGDFSESAVRAESAARAIEAGDAALLEENLFNTFDQALPRVEQRYADIKEAMRGAGLRGAMLSGSGAACFGLAASAAAAEFAAAALRGELGAMFPDLIALAANTTD